MNDKNKPPDPPALRKPGRPRKEFDLDLFDKFAYLQATIQEIAYIFGMHHTTVMEHIERTTGRPFPEYFAEKKEEGKISLRRLQWQKAFSGSTWMQIHLGKHWLGQVDDPTKIEVHHSGTIKLKAKVVLSDEQAEAVNSVMKQLNDDPDPEPVR